MPSTQTIWREIERGIPGARFERESHIRLGRLVMAFVKPILRWSLDEGDEARIIVSAIKRVDIATYRVVELPDTFDAAAIRRFENRMTRYGWSKTIRSREDGDNTWVFFRHRDDGTLGGLLVVDLDDDELSIVGVEGRLDELLASVIADEPGAFSDLFGS